jgi:ribosomal protein S1
MSKGFEALFEESLTTVDMKIGSILEAEVIKIEDEYVLITSASRIEPIFISTVVKLSSNNASKPLLILISP